MPYYDPALVIQASTYVKKKKVKCNLGRYPQVRDPGVSVSVATIFLNRVLPTVPAGPRLFLSRPFFLKEFVLCLRLLGVRWRRLLHSPWALDPALSSYLQSTKYSGYVKD